MITVETLVPMPDGSIAGLRSDGYKVCDFNSINDVVMGRTSTFGANGQKQLFNVLVPPHVIQSFFLTTKRYITLTDNNGKDMEDSDVRKTTNIERSEPENETDPKRRVRTYRVAENTFDGVTMTQMVRTYSYIGKTQYLGQTFNINVRMGLLEDVRTITFDVNGDCIYAVPYNIGYDKASAPTKIGYAIKLNGDSKWLVGSSGDGWRTVERQLKRPDKNIFYKSLQRYGLLGCTILFTCNLNNREHIACDFNRKLKEHGHDTYWWESDTEDYVSPVFKYSKVTGFRWFDRSGNQHDVQSDNIFTDAYEVYVAEGYNKKGTLKIELI